jgi:hypothetical protein
MSSIQRYAKTPRAWEALALPKVVGRQAHTLLLMANGRRSEMELSLLLGGDVSDLLQNLQQQGYLQFNAGAMAAGSDDETAVEA